MTIPIEIANPAPFLLISKSLNLMDQKELHNCRINANNNMNNPIQEFTFCSHSDFTAFLLYPNFAFEISAITFADRPKLLCRRKTEDSNVRIIA